MPMHVMLVVMLAAPAAAGDAVTAGGKLNGREVRFPAAGVPEGVKATVALLESCHSASDGTVAYTVADLKKARRGDHVRLVFARPVAVVVLNKRYEVSELVFTQPLNTGVFWLRAGGKVVRCSKYEFRRERRFEEWRGQARAVVRHQ